MGNPPRAAFDYDQKIVPSGPGVPTFSGPRGDFPNGSSDVGRPIAGKGFATDTCLNSAKHD
jgi:hypothetical protein